MVVFLIWSKPFLASRLIINLIDGRVDPLVWNVMSSLCHLVFLATTISLKAFGMDTAAGSGLGRQIYCWTEFVGNRVDLTVAGRWEDDATPLGSNGHKGVNDHSVKRPRVPTRHRLFVLVGVKRRLMRVFGQMRL